MPSKLAKKADFDARSLMERAVKVMHDSVQEHRPDGSPSPLVGAVLYEPDGRITTAARGELREGNHAEFTLLERKCAGLSVENGVLFTTLEPCVKRNEPKKGCAKHIVNARIKTVYVGIEDDNPAVAGKGIEFLERHGVEVKMFERDLQDEIRQANEAFFEWARKQIEKPQDEEISLSLFEKQVPNVALSDFSVPALNKFRDLAKITETIESEYFRALLRKLGVLTEANIPSGFGLLLFGDKPRDVLKQAGLLARVKLPNNKEIRKEFNLPMVLIPQELEEWINEVIPQTIDRSKMERSNQADVPFEMIREAVINALIHRDYGIEGEKCHLYIDSDVITVKSPGGPIPPITLQQLQSFSAPTKSRNPLLHYVFSQMGFAEEQNFGLETLEGEANRLDLPLPRFSLDTGSLVLTIFRTSQAVFDELPDKIKESLGDDEIKILTFASKQESITSADLVTEFGLDERKAQRLISKLVKANTLRRVGGGRSTRYESISPGK